MQRFYQNLITAHFEKYRQMLFFMGSRQSGKTTACQAILEKNSNSYYFNWDNQDHQEIIVAGVKRIIHEIKLNTNIKEIPIIIFDEIHKYKDWKNYMYFYANYAWIRSEVDVTNVAGAYKRPLQGQSPYVLNTGLNYNNPESLLSGGASFNRVGKRIVFVGTDIYPDFYENPRSVIDAQLSMKMAKSGKRENLVAKVKFNDILGQKIIIYQNKLADGTDYKAGTSREMRVTNPGRSISLSISYKF